MVVKSKLRNSPASFKPSGAIFIANSANAIHYHYFILGNCYFESLRTNCRSKGKACKIIWDVVKFFLATCKQHVS